MLYARHVHALPRIPLYEGVEVSALMLYISLTVIDFMGEKAQ